ALAVDVAQQRDVRGAVRVVLDALDAAGDAFLVALEVDDAVVLLGAAALVPRGDAAVVVAAAGLALRLDQRGIRCALVQPRRRDANHRAASRRSWLQCDQCHVRSRFLCAQRAHNTQISPYGFAVTSMLWPSCSRTYALRQPRRAPGRWRNALF